MVAGKAFVAVFPSTMQMFRTRASFSYARPNAKPAAFMPVLFGMGGPDNGYKGLGSRDDHSVAAGCVSGAFPSYSRRCLDDNGR